MVWGTRLRLAIHRHDAEWGAEVELVIDNLYPLQVAKTTRTREVIRLPIAEVMGRKCIKSRKDLDEVKRLGESQSWLTPCKRAGGPRSLVTDCDLVTCLEEELQHPQCFILPDNSSWLPFWDSSRKACLSRKCFKLQIKLIMLICLDVTE